MTTDMSYILIGILSKMMNKLALPEVLIRSLYDGYLYITRGKSRLILTTVSLN
jgi:hypothetical protein